MGIFRQPPAPFIGGKQPLEQKKLVPLEAAPEGGVLQLARMDGLGGRMSRDLAGV